MFRSRAAHVLPRRAHRWLVWLAVFAIFPGALSLAVDTVSLVAQGQTVDAEHAADVAAGVDLDCQEHGCSGLLHQCKCCASPPVIAPVAGTHLTGVSSLEDGIPASAIGTRASDGFPAELFRPPLA
jgi:hypothetical protein